MITGCKYFLKIKYFRALDFVMLSANRFWRRDLENRIDFDQFDPELSRKIDMAHDAEDVWRSCR